VTRGLSVFVIGYERVARSLCRGQLSVALTRHL